MTSRSMFHRLAALFGLVSLVLAAASMAWACVPQPLLTVIPASGPSGSELTASATGIKGEAELRWNALDGPVLATGLGPDFSVKVTIPDVPDGLYAMLLLERAPNGSVGSTSRAAVLVTSVPGVAGAPSSGTASTTAPSERATPRSSLSPTGWMMTFLAAATTGGLSGLLVSRRQRRQQPATIDEQPYSDQ